MKIPALAKRTAEHSLDAISVPVLTLIDFLLRQIASSVEWLERDYFMEYADVFVAQQAGLKATHPHKTSISISPGIPPVKSRLASSKGGENIITSWLVLYSVYVVFSSLLLATVAASATASAAPARRQTDLDVLPDYINRAQELFTRILALRTNPTCSDGPDSFLDPDIHRLALSLDTRGETIARTSENIAETNPQELAKFKLAQLLIKFTLAPSASAISNMIQATEFFDPEEMYESKKAIVDYLFLNLYDTYFIAFLEQYQKDEASTDWSIVNSILELLKKYVGNIDANKKLTYFNAIKEIIRFKKILPTHESPKNSRNYNNYVIAVNTWVINFIVPYSIGSYEAFDQLSLARPKYNNVVIPPRERGLLILADVFLLTSKEHFPKKRINEIYKTLEEAIYYLQQAFENKNPGKWAQLDPISKLDLFLHNVEVSFPAFSRYTTKTRFSNIMAGFIYTKLLVSPLEKPVIQQVMEDLNNVYHAINRADSPLHAISDSSARDKIVSINAHLLIILEYFQLMRPKFPSTDYEMMADIVTAVIANSMLLNSKSFFGVAVVSTFSYLTKTPEEFNALFDSVNSRLPRNGIHPVLTAEFFDTARYALKIHQLLWHKLPGNERSYFRHYLTRQNTDGEMSSFFFALSYAQIMRQLNHFVPFLGLKNEDIENADIRNPFLGLTFFILFNLFSSYCQYNYCKYKALLNSNNGAADSILYAVATTIVTIISFVCTPFYKGMNVKHALYISSFYLLNGGVIRILVNMESRFAAAVPTNTIHESAAPATERSGRSTRRLSRGPTHALTTKKTVLATTSTTLLPTDTPEGALLSVSVSGTAPAPASTVGPRTLPKAPAVVPIRATPTDTKFLYTRTIGNFTLNETHFREIAKSLGKDTKDVLAFFDKNVSTLSLIYGDPSSGKSGRTIATLCKYLRFLYEQSSLGTDVLSDGDEATSAAEDEDAIPGGMLQPQPQPQAQSPSKEGDKPIRTFASVTHKRHTSGPRLENADIVNIVQAVRLAKECIVKMNIQRAEFEKRIVHFRHQQMDEREVLLREVSLKKIIGSIHDLYSIFDVLYKEGLTDFVTKFLDFESLRIVRHGLRHAFMFEKEWDLDFSERLLKTVGVLSQLENSVLSRTDDTISIEFTDGKRMSLNTKDCFHNCASLFSIYEGRYYEAGILQRALDIPATQLTAYRAQTEVTKEKKNELKGELEISRYWIDKFSTALFGNSTLLFHDPEKANIKDALLVEIGIFTETLTLLRISPKDFKQLKQLGNKRSHNDGVEEITLPKIKNVLEKEYSALIGSLVNQNLLDNQVRTGATVRPRP